MFQTMTPMTEEILKRPDPMRWEYREVLEVKKSKISNKYINNFYRLNCSEDILNICYPINNREKEITEAYGIYRILKSLVLKNQDIKYRIVDLCAGNALSSIMAAFMLPISTCHAVDIKKRERDWDRIKKFYYCELDIYSDFIYSLINENTIIISTHPCSKLALRVIDIFKKSKAKHLLLMPCCTGEISYSDNPSKFLYKALGKYKYWCYSLASLVNGKLKEDINIISPKNIIITAAK